MKRSDLIALGVPESMLDAIMGLHGKSIESLKAKAHMNMLSYTARQTELSRSAIINMARLLKRKESLEKVLHTATAMYHQETASRKKEAAENQQPEIAAGDGESGEE